MTDKMKEPRKKWRTGQRAGHPFPVLVESVTGIPAHLSVWKTFSGRFNGDSVHVLKQGDISALYNMGFFGKGSLSRSCPRYAKKSLYPEIIRERQWKQRVEWMEEQRNSDGIQGSTTQHEVAESSTQPLPSHINEISDGNRCTKNKDDRGINSGENVAASGNQQEDCLEECKTGPNDVNPDSSMIVIADSVTHCDDFLLQLRPRLEKNPVRSREVLVLSLEEAVFLNYGLGCLTVQDSLGEKELSTSELWILSQKSNSRFVERYIVYHYFRSKNWVVKSGLKFGGDFLLYKEGPGIYHASYIVIVKVIQERGGGWSSESCMTWTSFMGLNRLAEASGKEILISYVIWPSDLPFELLPSPDVISRFKVHEVIVRRWQSSVARVSAENENKKTNSVDE